MQYVRQPSKDRVSDDNRSAVDFGEILEGKETTSETQAVRNSNLMKLSYILENLLYFEIDKICPKCNETLREEEVFSGFQKNLSSYTIKCPICSGQYVPKFKIYTEQENAFVSGRKGETISMLPPVCLYKEFINIISKEGD